MSEEEITDENYCDWRQSNCPLVKDYRARIAELEAALRPFADAKPTHGEYGEIWIGVLDEHIRAARAALKGEK
jgi:hypothetical protein